MRPPLPTLLLISALLLAGSGAWFVHFSGQLEVDARRLELLPYRFEEWSGRDVPLRDTVEQMLRADFNLQRAYVDGDGELAWLYVGYYGTARGGRPEHTPRNCYHSQGWEILRADVVGIDPARGLRAHRMLVQQEGEQRLVLFWYRSAQRTGILDDLGIAFGRLADRLRTGRADGALVRVSTPLDGRGEEHALPRLERFAAAVDVLIDAHWPVER